MICPPRPLQMILLMLAVTLANNSALAEWPTHLHDSARSGVTQEKIALPLQAAWDYQTLLPPKPAWPAPAPYDYWHKLPNLSPTVVYDRVFHPIVAQGKLYFASSADDQVCCLNATTGETLWRFFAQAPVRLAPTFDQGRIFFGADDGAIYCLNAEDGAELWRFRPEIPDRRLPGNGRLISMTPVRSGVIVENNIAYCAIGFFPTQAVYICAINAETGEAIWCKKNEEISPQGYMLASASRLFFPTGRTSPVIFSREDAEYLGQLGGGGGTFAVLNEETLSSGPSRRVGDELSISDPNTGESIATCAGVRMVVAGPMTYIQSKTETMALDRPEFIRLARLRNQQNAERSKVERILKMAEQAKNAEKIAQLNEKLTPINAEIARLEKAMSDCYVWRQKNAHPYGLILAGDTLFAGGENEVVALNARDGAQRWAAAVEGKAYGLCVSNGFFYVSTTTGRLYAFSAAGGEQQHWTEEPAQSPWPNAPETSLFDQAAEIILKQTLANTGYCLVLGAGDGRLAASLAQKSKLHIVHLETDAAVASSVRKRFYGEKLYGHRITVQSWDGKKLPYTPYCATLIASEKALMGSPTALSAHALQELITPYRGLAVIGAPESASTPALKTALHSWIDTNDTVKENAQYIEKDGAWAIVRAPIPSTAEWTQLYANPSHTAASSESWRGPLALQWFGEPGPQRIIDRHHRPMSSLYKEGRLFIPGLDTVFAVDAYNGAPIWTHDLPDSQRIGVLKNAGQMLVTKDYLYVARKNECLAIEVESGEQRLSLPAPDPQGTNHDWGYLNCLGNTLIGSGQAPDASFSKMSEATCAILEGDFRQVMASTYLFAVDRYSGAEKWTYQKGAILNSAICVDQDTLFFVESLVDKVINDKNGRVGIKTFCKGPCFLTALDIETGAIRWRHEIAVPFQHIIFLNGNRETLLLSGTYNKGSEVFYELMGFSMATGEKQWATPFRAKDVRGTDWAATEGSHGEQWQHPVIISETIYARPYAFDLKSGEQKDFIAYRGGHGCGGLTGCENYLFGRGSNPRMYPIDTKETEGIQVTKVSRPGCWLNMIPAGGLLMIPESSSGCTCAYPVQTSFAFIPKEVAGGVS